MYWIHSFSPIQTFGYTYVSWMMISCLLRSEIMEKKECTSWENSIADGPTKCNWIHLCILQQCILTRAKFRYFWNIFEKYIKFNFLKFYLILESYSYRILLSCKVHKRNDSPEKNRFLFFFSSEQKSTNERMW